MLTKPDENAAITIYLTTTTKEKMKQLAKHWKVSPEDTLRMAIDESYENMLGGRKEHFGGYTLTYEEYDTLLKLAEILKSINQTKDE